MREGEITYILDLKVIIIYDNGKRLKLLPFIINVVTEYRYIIKKKYRHDKKKKETIKRNNKY